MMPCWNEQITFTLKFPTVSHPLVVQLRDDEIMTDNVIGTTVISMEKISNPDKRGNGLNNSFKSE